MVRNQVRVRVRYKVKTQETSRVDRIQTHSNCIENKPKRPVTAESIKPSKLVVTIVQIQQGI